MEKDHFEEVFFNGRHGKEDGSTLNFPEPAGVRLKRVRGDRHEQCNDDLDCRNSRNQVCGKWARENFGRYECPYHQPLDVTVNGAVRCTTAKDLFDE